MSPLSRLNRCWWPTHPYACDLPQTAILLELVEAFLSPPPMRNPVTGVESPAPLPGVTVEILDSSCLISVLEAHLHSTEVQLLSQPSLLRAVFSMLKTFCGASPS